MNSKNSIDDRKTALKLINKYADSYNRCEEENRSLRKQIIDLKTTLSLNKDIIKGMISTNNHSDQSSLYQSKLKEENKKLSLIIESLNKEKEEIRGKLKYFEQTYQESILKLREENEKISNKCFILENTLKKKDTLLSTYKFKLDKLTSRNEEIFKKKISEKEILIAEPTQAITVLHNELSLYKLFHEKISEQVKEYTNKIERYEKKINIQHQEILQLNKKLGIENQTPILSGIKIEEASTLSTNHKIYKKKKEKLALTEKNSSDSDSGNLNLNSPMAEHYPKKIEMNTSHTDYKEFLPSLSFKKDNKKNLKLSKNKSSDDKTLNQYFESEEWKEILKIVNLNDDEVKRLIRNKVVCKLINAFEIVVKILKQKSIQIENFENSQTELNKKIETLTYDHMETIKYLNSLRENKIIDDSMIGNLSKISLSVKQNQTFNDELDNDSKIFDTEINIKSEIEESENKSIKGQENYDMEIKINEDVFNDLKIDRSIEIKKKIPSYSQKMNNIMKVLDNSNKNKNISSSIVSTYKKAKSNFNKQIDICD